MISALIGMGLAASASSAGAAVKVGETFTPDGGWGGTGVMIQVGVPAGVNVISTPGVLTSWSFEDAGIDPTPPLKLKVMRPAGGDDFTTVGDSTLQTPAPGVLNTWPTQISVNPGDLLALFFTDDTYGYGNPSDPAWATQEISGLAGSDCCDPAPGTTTPFESPATGQRADVSAMLEPDCDKDGLGDETQDTDLSSCAHPTGQRAAALKKCKKKHKKALEKKTASHTLTPQVKKQLNKKFKKCKKRAGLLPV